jgi:hypothetical protein
MGVHELIPLAKQLNRADKLRLMQSLLYDLAREEGIALPVEEQLLLAGKSYPVWSPSTAYEAGETLCRTLARICPVE